MKKELEGLRDAAVDWLTAEGYAVFPLETADIPEAVRERVLADIDSDGLGEILKDRGDFDFGFMLEDKEVKELARERDIKLAEDGEWRDILRTASQVAFGTFAEWPELIERLRALFREAGATSATTAQFLLED
jgi:hypothetical protein